MAQVEGVEGAPVFFVACTPCFVGPNTDDLLRSFNPIVHLTHIVGTVLILVMDYNVSAHKTQIVHQSVGNILGIGFTVSLRRDQSVLCLAGDGLSVSIHGSDQNVVLVLEVEHIETTVARDPVVMSTSTVVVRGNLPEFVGVDIVHLRPKHLGHLLIVQISIVV